MNNEQFDRILHSRLADHKVTPPPEVWAGIEKRKSNKRGLIGWMSVLMILVVFSGLYFLIPKDTHTNEIQTVQEAVISGPLISLKQNNQDSEPALINHASVIEKPSVTTNPITSKANSSEQQSILPSVNTSGLSVNSSDEISDLPAVPLLWLEQIDSDVSISPALSVLSSEAAAPSALTRNLSLVFTAGPLLADKHLKSKYQYSGDDKYIRYRQESELRNSAWSASFLLQVEVSKNFFVRTGINYTSISEKIGLRYIKAQIDGITTDTIVGTRNEFTDPAQLLSVSENENFQLLADYTLRDKAEYRFLSFPLMAGFASDKKRLSFYASAGLALNFSSAYQGKILAPDSAYLFSIKEETSSPFTRLTGFTVMTSAGVGFSVSEKFKLLFEPSYFLQLPDFTKTNYRLSQRFSGYGIQAGVIYKL